LVTSAAEDLATSTGEELTKTAVDEVRRFLPAAREATLHQSRVLKERAATPVFGPGTESIRPGPGTAVPNLTLAGDWTATGLPATLEGAAASGHRAAELLEEGA
jgi:zeta-carotene desaturase